MVFLTNLTDFCKWNPIKGAFVQDMDKNEGRNWS